MKFRADVRRLIPSPFPILCPRPPSLLPPSPRVLFHSLCLSSWPARRGLKYSRMHKDVKYGRMNQLVFLRSERVRRRVWQYPRGGILRGLAPPGFMAHFVYAQTGQGCRSIHRHLEFVCAPQRLVGASHLCEATHDTELNSFPIRYLRYYVCGYSDFLFPSLLVVHIPLGKWKLCAEGWNYSLDRQAKTRRL